MTDPKQSMIKRRHPGAGKKRTGKTPKGRQVDPASLTEIQRLLAVRSRRRDYHLIQDRFGYLSAAYLAALAGEMQMALAEVYEVATFSARFDVVKEGEAPPPPVTPVLRTSTRLPGRRKLQGVLAASSLRKPVEGMRVNSIGCRGLGNLSAPVAAGSFQSGYPSRVEDKGVDQAWCHRVEYACR